MEINAEAIEGIMERLLAEGGEALVLDAERAIANNAEVELANLGRQELDNLLNDLHISSVLAPHFVECLSNLTQ